MLELKYLITPLTTVDDNCEGAHKSFGFKVFPLQGHENDVLLIIHSAHR